MEMLQLNLDKLSTGEQLMVTCEIMRRMQQRITLVGLKMTEGNLPTNSARE